MRVALCALIICTWYARATGLMLGRTGDSEEFRPMALLPPSCLEPLSEFNATCPPNGGDLLDKGTVFQYNPYYLSCQAIQVYNAHCRDNNRFLSLEECTTNCTHASYCPEGCSLVHDSTRRQARRCQCDLEESKRICSLPADPGTCHDVDVEGISRFHFNANLKSCEEFHYSRCGGNANNFGSEIKCKDVCMYGHAASESILPTYLKRLSVLLLLIGVFYFIFSTDQEGTRLLIRRELNIWHGTRKFD